MKIKVLLVIPNREAEIKRIPNNLKFIKAFIGNELYKIKLDDDTVLIGNKNAELDEFNRILGENIILGTFIIVSMKNNHMVSIKKKDIRKYSNMFKLRKHKKKLERYKSECLEEYYSNIRKIKQDNAERNKKEIFNIAA